MQDHVSFSRPILELCYYLTCEGASILDFSHSIPRRELDLIAYSSADLQCQLHRFSNSQTVDEYAELLHKASMVLPILAQDASVVEVASSAIWHTDLHLGNIFVSHDDPTKIEGIIDWQSVQAAPLFIQARFPEFLRPPKDYISGTEVPRLPDNFDDLDTEQREEAIDQKTLASQSKYYEMSCLGYNKQVYNAMKLDRRLWELFTCCQLFTNGSLVPLRNSLICLCHDWDLLDLPGACLYGFTEDELQRHDEQTIQYQDSRYLWDMAKTQLCTDDSGWVPVERWEVANELNEHLHHMYMEDFGEQLKTGSATPWPFPPNKS